MMPCVLGSMQQMDASNSWGGSISSLNSLLGWTESQGGLVRPNSAGSVETSRGDASEMHRSADIR